MTATIIDLDEERRKRNLPLPRIVPVIDEDFDDMDIPVMDRALCWGPEDSAKLRLLTRYLSERQGDPGDEI